jgi:hypothetical protein
MTFLHSAMTFFNVLLVGCNALWILGHFVRSEISLELGIFMPYLSGVGGLLRVLNADTTAGRVGEFLWTVVAVFIWMYITKDDHDDRWKRRRHKLAAKLFLNKDGRLVTVPIKG